MYNSFEQQVKCIAVRISLEEGKQLVGSGVVLPCKKYGYAFIFTAAHVIEKIYESATNENINVHLCFSDVNNNSNNIEIVLRKRNIWEDFCDNGIGYTYLHKEYNKKDRCYPKNDGAVICIQYRKWMKDLPQLRICEYRDGKALLVGFPAMYDTVIEKKEDERFISFRGNIICEEVIVENQRNKNLVVKNVNPNRDLHVDVDRNIDCLSGGGIITKGVFGLQYHGAFSSSKNTGKDTYYATSSKVFLEIIEEYQLPIWLNHFMRSRIYASSFKLFVIMILIGLVLICNSKTVRLNKPELYWSNVVPYGDVGESNSNMAECTIADYGVAFSIVSHLKSNRKNSVKIDHISTRITEIELDESLDISAVGGFSENQLKIFIINNSWGTSENIRFEIYFDDRGEERPITDFADVIYESQQELLRPGQVMKGAAFNLEVERFKSFRNKYESRNQSSVIPIQYRILADGYKNEGSIGCVGYEESRSGFYIRSQDPIKPNPHTDTLLNTYDLLFSKLDVEKSIDNFSRQGICQINYTGKSAYPIVENYITVETAIAPTRSCQLKCYNMFEIDGEIYKTNEKSVSVKVPYYQEGIINSLSTLTTTLLKADSDGVSDLYNELGSFVYDADSVAPHEY